MVDGMRTMTGERWRCAELVWEFHRMRHELRRCDAAVVLGCNDIGVAVHAAELYRAALFPVAVFTGGNSAATVEVFPRGEAVHFRGRALELGVPDPAVLVEPEAANTGQNIAFSRRVLAANGIDPASVLLVCMPYMERRAFATAWKQWSEVEVVCSSAPLSLGEYVERFEDPGLVIDMMAGDLQRVMEYPRLGFAIEQDVPRSVREAYGFLVASGFDGCLIPA